LASDPRSHFIGIPLSAFVACHHGGFAYTAGIGFFDDAGQQPAEIFLTTAKHGTLLDTNARDAAIAASLLLQHGCPAETLRRALTRNGDGSASGPLAHVLDLLHQQRDQSEAGHLADAPRENGAV
jgi:hypothetical protein